MLQRFGSCGTEAKEKSEFKPPLQVAALCVPVCFNWRCSRCHCHSKSELGVETLRVELMTGEVVGIEVFIAPTWTSKYIGCDGFAELARRYVICEIEDRYVDVGPGQVRGRREIGRLREQQDNITMWSRRGV